MQSTTAPSIPEVPQPGSHGLRREFFNDTSLEWHNFDSIGVYKETLLTQFESETDIYDRIGNRMKGWFIAPETTQYRFHLACDDYCYIAMGLNTSDPLSTTTLVETFSWKPSRDFYTMKNDVISDWVNLTKGEAYFITGRHLEGGGGDNYAVGVEINQTTIENHHHSIREIQYVEAYI